MDDRDSFIKRFSPEVLKATNGIALLKLFAYPKKADDNLHQQFGDLFEDNYDSLKIVLEKQMKSFGSGNPGYDYNFILAYRDGAWHNFKTQITFKAAVEFAEYIKNELLEAISYIEKDDFNGFYKYVSNSTSGFFNKGYTHKYFYILYPKYFIHYHSGTWQDYYQNSLGLPKTQNYYDIEKYYLEKYPGCNVGQKSRELEHDYGKPPKIQLPSGTETSITEEPISIPLNQILYGPPGTGKTYNTVIKAMEIINPACIKYDEKGNLNYAGVKKAYDEAKKNGQIEFVTFHQSYAYEEFVEGIKPDLDSEDLKYELKDGIFKRICKNAETPILENKAETGIRDNPNIWKISLNGTENNEIKQYCMDNDCIRVSYREIPEDENEEFDFKTYKDKYLSLKRFKEEMEIGDIILSCSSLKTIDAIGVITGEYQYNDTFESYKRYRKVKWLVKGLNYNILKINSGLNFNRKAFHRVNNMSFNDILPLINSKGQVVKYTENRKPYVLIIDEINRGNISKIFGELITLIEPDKRQGAAHEIKAKLPYSQSPFAVPQNLYIIGTMNTSDRSIAAVDIALRRRFKFIEIMPDSNLVADFGIGFKDIFEKLNTRIKLLLDRDHQIGHSYFINTKYKNANAETLKQIWFQEILPLLNEYFYCDWEKLKLVVPGFITKVDNIPAELKDECEDSAYEFKTEENFKDIKDFKNALTQDKFEKGN